MKSNWHHQNFWAKGQGQTSKIFTPHPDLPAHKISRTLQFSQNIKLINPNNQHNKQTNLIEHYQFWTDWVEFTSSKFHGQTLSSTFQNFHSSPRPPRPQNFSNFANFTNHQTHQTHQSTQQTHSSHHIQPIPLQINHHNFSRPNHQLNPKNFDYLTHSLCPKIHQKPKCHNSSKQLTTNPKHPNLSLTTHSQLNHSNSTHSNFHRQTLQVKLPKFPTFWPGPSAQKIYTQNLDPQKLSAITLPISHNVHNTLLFHSIHFSNANRFSSFQNTPFKFTIFTICDLPYPPHQNTPISLILSHFIPNPMSIHPPNPPLSIHTLSIPLQNFHNSNHVYKYFQTPIFQYQTFVKNWHENSRSRKCLGVTFSFLALTFIQTNHAFPNLNFQKV